MAAGDRLGWIPLAPIGAVRLQTPHMAPGRRRRCAFVPQPKLGRVFLDGRGVELGSGRWGPSGASVLEGRLCGRVVHPGRRLRVGAVGNRCVGALERRSKACHLTQHVCELRGGVALAGFWVAFTSSSGATL